MAARRLLIIMVILLGITMVTALTLPDPSTRDDGEETTTEPATETAPADRPAADAEPAATEPEPDGEAEQAAFAANCDVVRCFQLDADAKKVTVVPAKAGDQVFLEVVSDTPDLVEIRALGLFDAVGPDNPATFDLLMDSAGDYGIFLDEAERLIGRIETKPAG